ncbi:MAG: NADPH:quinone oxidoreductase family protein [Gammaproteobacteria bacterium]|nr:NADPH:quinone oxidoreductase family protein [Gammaproteobacteria bacterium]
MKGVLVKEWTEFEKLTISQDVPRPELGPRSVRIATHAAGVSFATSLVVAGRYQRKPPRPFVPGTEVSGIVTEIGSQVRNLSVGDRVVGAIDWGGMAEEAVAPEATVFKIPDKLDFSVAIALTNSYMTSYAALTWEHLLRVGQGDSLVVHGAAGGVGIAAIEIGKILGATVIANVGSEEKRDIVLSHGADHVINYREESFREIVQSLTDGVGANAVYDPVGGDVFMQSLRCLAPEGRICPIGFAGGDIPQIPANILLVKNLTVCGLNMGYYFGWSPTDMRWEYETRMRAMMEQLVTWWSEDKIHPRVSHTFALEDFQEAMQVVLGRKAMGRVTLRIA